MSKVFQRFEKIARVSGGLSYGLDEEVVQNHPFDERNIHPSISSVSMGLFDDGHYSQAPLRRLNILTI